MRARQLIRKSLAEDPGMFSQQGLYDNYEERLSEWGCSECRFFENRVMRGRAPSRELDEYAVCRFTGEPVDLIWEATACPKTAELKICKDQHQGNQARRQKCRHAA
jgi:hypothetical protein